MLKFNQIDFKQGDILDLFGISGIALPTEYQFPSKFYTDYHEVQQEYAMCLIYMQKQFQSVNCIHQSFYEFAQQTVRIVNCINHALSQQFELINYIYLFYHFVDTLASPSQQKIRQVDSLSYDIDQLKGTVLKTHLDNIPEQRCRQIADFVKLDPSFRNHNSEQYGQLEQLSISLTEFVELRNFFYDCLDKLR